MDTFNFLLSTLIMMVAIQLNEPFIALGILVINIITSKELSTSIAFILATGVIYLLFGSGSGDNFWLAGIFAIIVLGIVLGSKGEPQQAADPFGGLGGMGGFGGEGGFGGGY